MGVNGLAGTDYAIDTARNACMVEATGCDPAFDVRVAKAAAGGAWTSLVAGRERVLMPSAAFGSTAYSVHPTGGGHFFVVVGYMLTGGNRLAVRGRIANDGAKESWILARRRRITLVATWRRRA